MTEKRAGLDPRARKTIYHAAAAVFAGLGIYGVISAEEAAEYIQAVILILGIAPAELAAGNTPAKERPERVH